MAEKYNGTIEDSVSIHNKKVIPALEQNQADEENKIIDKTKFNKWLTDVGNDDCLYIPTKAIEQELRILIGIAREAERKKHEKEVKEMKLCFQNGMSEFCPKRNCGNSVCPLNLSQEDDKEKMEGRHFMLRR